MSYDYNGKVNTGSHTGILTLLQVMFIGFKIAGVVEWSWWYVFMPTLAPLALIVALVLVSIVIATVMYIVKGIYYKIRRKKEHTED